MLRYFECYQQYRVPVTLQGEILNSKNEIISNIETLNKVNIFIGPNNSGKSKILRELLKQPHERFYSEHNFSKIRNAIESLFSKAESLIMQVYIGKNLIIQSNVGVVINLEANSLIKPKFIENRSSYDLQEVIDYINNAFILPIANVDSFSSFFINQPDRSSHYFQGTNHDNLFANLKKLKELAENTLQQLEKLKFNPATATSVNKIYIPSIRTLRPFAKKLDLCSATQVEYNFQSDVSIINGQELPGRISDWTNSNFVNRRRKEEFEELLSSEFFDLEKVSITHDKKSDILLIKIGQQKDRPIHELGDGLQMLICMTFPFFFLSSGIVVIEEPELFIHAGLQKRFLKFLTNNSATDNFQIFLSTHSNHVIDAINESELISLFSVRTHSKLGDTSQERNPNFIIDNVAHGHRNLLTILGITNTSVYLSNCTIWVEGVTDKLYLQKFLLEFLRKIGIDSEFYPCKQFKEGVHYTFVLSGGDSIIHWDFGDESQYANHLNEIIAIKFCGKSMVIVDNDFNKNIKRKEALSQVLGNRLLILPVPEIENLLSVKTIKKTVLQFPSVSNITSEAALPDIPQKLLDTAKLGYIIDSHLLLEFPSSKQFAKTKGRNASIKSGDKVSFCLKALDSIEGNDLGKNTERIVKAILMFIAAQNEVDIVMRES